MRWLKFKTVIDCGEAEQFTTIDEYYAVRIIRRNFPDRDWTEAGALEEFILQFEAVYVGDPHMHEETTVTEAAQSFLDKFKGSVQKAANKAGCMPHDFFRMMDNRKKTNPPVHVLQKLGIFREVRYFKAPAPNKSKP